jgi:hypothetical protein
MPSARKGADAILILLKWQQTSCVKDARDVDLGPTHR